MNGLGDDHDDDTRDDGSAASAPASSSPSSPSWWRASAPLTVAALERMSWHTLVRCVPLLGHRWRAEAMRVARERYHRAFARFRNALLAQCLPSLWADWAHYHRCVSCAGPLRIDTVCGAHVWLSFANDGDPQPRMSMLCAPCFAAAHNEVPRDQYVAVPCAWRGVANTDARPRPHAPPRADYAAFMVPSRTPERYSTHRVHLTTSDTALERLLVDWLRTFGTFDVEFAVGLRATSRRLSSSSPSSLQQYVGNILDWLPVAAHAVKRFTSRGDLARLQRTSCNGGGSGGDDGRSIGITASLDAYDPLKQILVLQCCNAANTAMYGTHHYFYNGHWFARVTDLSRHLLTAANCDAFPDDDDEVDDGDGYNKDGGAGDDYQIIF